VVLAGGTDLEREVSWGLPWQAGTAAYWVRATEFVCSTRMVTDDRHRLGVDLRQEVAACILGGWGMPFEIGLAAFRAVADELLQPGQPTPPRVAILEILSRQFKVKGKTRRYRFPQQRADRLVGALDFLERTFPRPSDAREIRDWLTQAPGVGLKTASWVVRNHWDSDEVAIVDVHILRAGITAGIFDSGWSPERNYKQLETLFLAWAREGGVRASDLDAVVWAEQAEWSRFARRGALACS
jgi:thermostable 8-oxoguanine DNA glycosylase